MKQSSAAIQVVANDAGIPFSAAETLLKHAAMSRRSYRASEYDWAGGKWAGICYALVVLGADAYTVERAIDIINDEE